MQNCWTFSRTGPARHECSGWRALAIMAAGDRLERAERLCDEAYNNVLRRGEDLMDLLPELGWLLEVAIVGMTLALLVPSLRL